MPVIISVGISLSSVVVCSLAHFFFYFQILKMSHNPWANSNSYYNEPPPQPVPPPASFTIRGSEPNNAPQPVPPPSARPAVFGKQITSPGIQEIRGFPNRLYECQGTIVIYQVCSFLFWLSLPFGLTCRPEIIIFLFFMSLKFLKWRKMFFKRVFSAKCLYFAPKHLKAGLAERYLTSNFAWDWEPLLICI